MEYRKPDELPEPLTLEAVKHAMDKFRKKDLLNPQDVLYILAQGSRILRRLPNINRATAKFSEAITICGDMHGSFEDLLTIFMKNGLPSNDNPYVFNGDYVDRGQQGLEVIMTLLMFVMLYPNAIYLNRGNHEDAVLNARYGFIKEINKKYPEDSGEILEMIHAFYRSLPLCTVIDNQVFVVHGGISEDTDLDDIEQVPRSEFLTILKREPITEELEREREKIRNLLWSDPISENGCSKNEHRGAGKYFGPDVTKRFCERHGFRWIVRSHECRPRGFEYTHNDQVVTLFSVSNYYAHDSNWGAYLRYRSDGHSSMVQYNRNILSRERASIAIRIGQLESTAIRELKNLMFERKDVILRKLRDIDTAETGEVKIEDWTNVMKLVLRVDLNWEELCPHLGKVNEGRVNYESCMSGLEMSAHPLAVSGLFSCRFTRASFPILEIASGGSGCAL